MKIVATIADANYSVYVGCDVERTSVIIEIPDEQVPAALKRHFERREWVNQSPNRYFYETLLFSLLEE